MKSAVEKVSPTRAKLTIEVTDEELKPAIDKAARSIASQVSIPGFRRGKVPTKIIEQRMGRGAIVQEAVNESLPQWYQEALEEHKVSPMGQADLELEELPLEAGQQLKAVFEVDCRPEIKVPDVTGRKVEVEAREVTDEDVQERLEALRLRFGTTKSVDKPATKGGFVTLDLTAALDGEQIDSVEGFSYEVGQGTLLEGTDEALEGMAKGESKTFTSKLAGGEHQGKDADITITVQDVKERELPEVDDDFAQLASEFDTVDELRASLREVAERDLLYTQGIAARDKLLDELIDELDIPVPDAVVEAEVHSHLEGEGRLDDDEHRAEITERSAKALRTTMLLDQLVEDQDVQLEQNEIIEFLMMSAQQYGMAPQQFIQAVEQQGQIPAMVAEAGRRKALATILDAVSIVDTEGNPIELSKLDIEEEEGEMDGKDDVTPSKQEKVAEAAVEQSDTAETETPLRAEEGQVADLLEAAPMVDQGEEPESVKDEDTVIP